MTLENFIYSTVSPIMLPYRLLCQCDVRLHVRQFVPGCFGLNLILSLITKHTLMLIFFMNANNVLIN